MVVHGNEQVRTQFDRPQIGNLLDAQFSFQYSLAVGAVSGRATLDQFVPFRFEVPEVQRLMSATSVVADRSMKPGEYPPLEIRFTDGRSVERHIPFAKGAPENPLSDDELHRKAVSQIEPVFGKRRCDELISCVLKLESVPEFGELTRLLKKET
jgi:2-methylcitrate dehydratase PrpD